MEPRLVPNKKLTLCRKHQHRKWGQTGSKAKFGGSVAFIASGEWPAMRITTRVGMSVRGHVVHAQHPHNLWGLVFWVAQQQGVGVRCGASRGPRHALRHELCALCQIIKVLRIISLQVQSFNCSGCAPERTVNPSWLGQQTQSFLCFFNRICVRCQPHLLDAGNDYRPFSTTGPTYLNDY